MEIKKVVVAGGGVLGSQIAYQSAYRGFDVTVWLRSDASIERARPKFARLKGIYLDTLEAMKTSPTAYCRGLAPSADVSAAEALLANDVADVETIDKTWMLATGAPVGPFRILDIVGLTTAYNIVIMNPDASNQSTTAGKIATTLKSYIDAGKTGVNAGEGFYKYN